MNEPTPTKPFDIVVSTQQLSDITGISTRVLQLRVQAGIVPKLAHGKFSLCDAVQSLLAHVAGSHSGDDVGDLSPRQKLDFYSAEMKRIDLMERCKELIPVAEVETEMRSLFSTFVGFLETLPDVLERDCGLSGASAERVQQAIDEARDRLHAAMGSHSP